MKELRWDEHKTIKYKTQNVLMRMLFESVYQGGKQGKAVYIKHISYTRVDSIKKEKYNCN